MSAILPVITHPNPLLRQQARLISIAEIHDAAMQQLYQNMITTMYADDGIGLAAPQVGQSIRVITVGKDAFEDQKNLPFGVQDMVFINPELSEYSFKTVWEEEGCLSVPGVRGEVCRHTKLTAKVTLVDGNTVTFVATDFLARVLQHEVDHLNGILFIDRARGIQKNNRRAAL